MSRVVELLLVAAIGVVGVIIVIALLAAPAAKTPTCPDGYALTGGGWSRLYCTPGVEVQYR